MDNGAPRRRSAERHVRLSVIAAGVGFVASVGLLIFSSLADGTWQKVALAVAGGALGAGLGVLVPAIRAILIDSFRRPTRRTILIRDQNGDGMHETVRVLEEGGQPVVRTQH
jgi:hypothetical protein